MGTVTGENPAAAPEGAVRAAELAIGGMTCASCAARIETKLNKLDGVAATVNFATETARVTFPAAMPPDELISAVERAGYTAILPAPRQDEPAGQAAGDDGATAADSLRQRLLVSLALAIPVVALAMVPALQFRNWQWASLALASPAAVGGVAVSPRRDRQRPARRRHHGHADLARGGRRVPLVAVRAVLRRRGPAGDTDELCLARPWQRS
jgi:Cu+-exporting ATPase